MPLRRALALGLGSIALIVPMGTSIARGDDNPPPPPPFPTHLTPTPNKAATAAALHIVKASIVQITGSTYAATHTVILGQKVRFIMAWRADSPLYGLRPGAQLVIMQGSTVVLTRPMGGKAAAMGGIYTTTVRLNNAHLAGKLTAVFTLAYSTSTATRSIHFTAVRSDSSGSR